MESNTDLHLVPMFKNERNYTPAPLICLNWVGNFTFFFVMLRSSVSEVTGFQSSVGAKNVRVLHVCHDHIKWLLRVKWPEREAGTDLCVLMRM